MIPTNPWSLTTGEEKVMDLLCCGEGPEKIAAMMTLSKRTVENYRSNATFKMGCPGHVARAAVLWDRFAMGREDE